MNFNRDEYIATAEEMPMPIGGMREIAANVHYPEIAKRAGIEGRVFVKAFIDEKGNVVETEIIKGIGAGCSEAAAEAVKKTKFKPGRQGGKPVKVQVTVPILFKLDSNPVNKENKSHPQPLKNGAKINKDEPNPTMIDSGGDN